MAHKLVAVLATLLAASWAFWAQAEEHVMVEVHGSGTSNPGILLWKVRVLVQQQPTISRVAYRVPCRAPLGNAVVASIAHC